MTISKSKPVAFNNMGHLMNVLFEKYLKKFSIQILTRAQKLNEITLELKNISSFVCEYIDPYLKQVQRTDKQTIIDIIE